MSETKKTKKYYEGVGRRKTSVARARLTAGEGKVTINDKSYEIPKKGELNYIWWEPLVLTATNGKFDLSVKLNGGGVNSGIDAIRLGISRALVEYDQKFKSILRKSGFLTRDPRAKERKKPGLKRARRAPQWQKR